MSKIATLSAILTGGLLMAATSAQAETWATSIFDKTGSMQSLRSNGESRCEFGKRKLIDNLKIALGKADYINVKTFAGPNALTSLTSGFKNIQGYTPTNTQGQNFLNQIESQLAQVSCTGSTALGDAICLSADELRNNASAGSKLRMLTITDAGENSSVTCGGPIPGYISTHIVPKIFASPMIQYNTAILYNGGNVNRAYATQRIADLEGLDPLKMVSGRSQAANARDQEVSQLLSLSAMSGGKSIVISDTRNCDTGCNPGDDDDWGGEW
ncbi:hypothetical protein [Aliikangiella coralliicola]|uniref:Uncharacterized protein n=1 Tax=Aliikangiella coralliicola TaxID=2592383 RepID=A0A545UC24_9GAMM|nr:hypothetical protein [Aliikangiella coralliicola]TQV87014.1 hypothetical protein FLL46_14500 [Aliikangiella coralliicola]